MSLHGRLLLALLVGNVCLKFLTNYLQILPRHFNLFDVFSVFALLALAALPHRNPVDSPTLLRRVVRFGLLFNLVAILGLLNNLHSSHMPAVFSQLVMWNEPVLLCYALLKLGLETHDAEKYDRILRRLIFIQLCIGIIQFPIFMKTGESESLMGTFQHNAEQYGAFLATGVFYFLGRLRTGESARTTGLLILIVAVFLFLCIDNKASWFGFAVSLFAVITKLGRLKWGFRGAILSLLAFTLLGAIGILVVSKVSGTLYKFERLHEAWRTASLSHLGKIKALRDIVKSHTQHPEMWVIGAGPGTFYSRSSRQFFPLKTMYTISSSAAVPHKQTVSMSDSMGNLIQATHKKTHFHQFYEEDRERIFAIGTAQVDEPFSTYNGLLGETGLLGTFLYIAIYISAFRFLGAALLTSEQTRVLFPMHCAAYGLLIYMVVNSIYTPFLETGRMTTILWSLIAVCACINVNQRDTYSNASTASPA